MRLFPYNVMGNNASGSLKATLEIDADGNVTDIKNAESTPPEIINDETLAKIRAIKFEPALENCITIAATHPFSLAFRTESH